MTNRTEVAKRNLEARRKAFDAMSANDQKAGTRPGSQKK